MAEEAPPPVPLPPHVHAKLVMSNAVSVSVASISTYWQPTGEMPVNTLGEAQQLADGIKAHFVNQIRSVLIDHCYFNAVVVRMVGYAEQWDAQSTDAASQGLIIETPAMPEEVAVCIQRRTGLPGRDMRGRVFMPYVPRTFLVNESRLSDDAIAAYRALGIRFRTVISGLLATAWTPVHISRKTGLAAQVKDTRVDIDVMSQRGRRAPKQVLAVA